ncbi:MAG TPA: PLP-dependent aminotransferase family protein [Solibacterales bacterium]|nr:PLP-dependent aminotransferase family protein [Bryobacterales bacterium]
MLPRLHLDADASEPLYRQLCEQIRSAILEGRLEHGARLPATRELAGSLGLNRATVSAAYELLEAEGLVRGHVGRGSFVERPGAPLGGVRWESMLPPLDAPAAGEAAISFAASRPSEQLFPLDPFRATCEEVIRGPEAAHILQLGSPAGYGPLRRYLMEEAKAAGVARAADDVLVSNGAQQALDLLQRVLISTGDTVLLEDPVYHGLRNILAHSGARVLGVPMTAAGVDVDALARAVERERPRLVVLTPNFHNPTGTTMPRAARLAALRATVGAGVVLVENDTYGELRYSGQPLPTLKELDESGSVVLLKSFSKIAFPGLRVGWVIAPRALVSRLAEAKQWCDLHTDQLSQAVMLRFATSGRLAAHRTRVLAHGAACLRAVLGACEKHLPPGADFTRPEGGMNVWVRLPAPLDAGELQPRAAREGVSYLPGRFFEVSRREPRALRLSFAGLAPDTIRRGVATLGKVFAAELEHSAGGGREFNNAPALV